MARYAAETFWSYLWGLKPGPQLIKQVWQVVLELPMRV